MHGIDGGTFTPDQERVLIPMAVMCVAGICDRVQ
nr:hypothetical protein [Sicyoidochytrium minutum DNA virus]